MIELTRELMLPIIDKARLAPSVHNIQPSRWRIGNDRLELLGDPARTIPVADPEGRDWRLSHGASLEGVALALAGSGLKLQNIVVHPTGISPDHNALLPIAEMSVVPAAQVQPLGEVVHSRVSWRGKFRAADTETNKALAMLDLARDDCCLIRDQQLLSEVTLLANQAGMFFLRDKDHRCELLDWMRLSKSHERYNTDGLNAAAMNMSAPEAWGAGLVLGPLFSALDAIGLAKPLVSETAKNKSAAAFVVFHRPRGEDALDSGRAFYQAWLTMERYGLSACPVSVLADWQQSRDTLFKRCNLPAGRQIVSVFRIGRPVKVPRIAHTRLPTKTLLI